MADALELNLLQQILLELRKQSEQRPPSGTNADDHTAPRGGGVPGPRDTTPLSRQLTHLGNLAQLTDSTLASLAQGLQTLGPTVANVVRDVFKDLASVGPTLKKWSDSVVGLVQRTLGVAPRQPTAAPRPVTYEVAAFDDRGQAFRGRVQAVDDEDLIDTLFARGMRGVKFERVEPQPTDTGPAVTTEPAVAAGTSPVPPSAPPPAASLLGNLELPLPVEIVAPLPVPVTGLGTGPSRPTEEPVSVVPRDDRRGEPTRPTPTTLVPTSAGRPVLPTHDVEEQRRSRTPVQPMPVTVTPAAARMLGREQAAAAGTSALVATLATVGTLVRSLGQAALATAMLPGAIRNVNAGVLESYRESSQVSPAMAMVMASYDINRMFADYRVGQRTAQSAKFLVDAQDRLTRSWEPIQVGFSDITNYGLGAISNAAAWGVDAMKAVAGGNKYAAAGVATGLGIATVGLAALGVSAAAGWWNPVGWGGVAVGLGLAAVSAIAGWGAWALGWTEEENDPYKSKQGANWTVTRWLEYQHQQSLEDQRERDGLKRGVF